MTVPHQPKRLPGPDIVRALAIILVVLAHTSGMWRTGPQPMSWTSFVHYLWPSSAVAEPVATGVQLAKGRTWVPAVLGVELFFVLSGFLIGGLLLRDIEETQKFTPTHFFRFLMRRWLRTLPAYWLVITAMIPLWVFVVHKTLTWKVLGYYFFLQNFVTPHPGFYSVGWSLSVEEWFYVLLGLGLCLAGSRNANSKRILQVLLWLLAGAFMVRLLNAFWLPYGTDFDNGIRKLVITRLDAPLYGVLLAWLVRYKPQILHIRRPLLAASLLGTLVLVAVMYYLEPRGSHQLHWFYRPFNTVLVHTLVPAVMALCLPYAAAYRGNSSAVLMKMLSFVARISYSIYLTHYYIFYLLPFSRVHFQSLPAQLLFYAVYLLVVVLLSSLLYKLIEKPFLSLRDRLFPGLQRPTHSAGV